MQDDEMLCLSADPLNPHTINSKNFKEQSRRYDEEELYLIVQIDLIVRLLRNGFGF